MYQFNMDAHILKECGVYQIRNLKNGRVYIGSTYREFRRRFREHYSQLSKNIHTNTHLQRAWNTYGESCFVFEVLDVVSSKIDIEDHEQFYLNQKSSVDLYNISIDARCPTRGRKFIFTEEHKQKIAESAKGRISPIKGKTYEELYGVTRAKEMRRANIERQKGISLEERCGREKAEKIKQASRENCLSRPNPSKGKSPTPEHRQKISTALKANPKQSEHNRKLNEAKKGKTYEELYGEEKALELKTALKKRMTGNKNGKTIKR